MKNVNKPGVALTPGEQQWSGYHKASPMDTTPIDPARLVGLTKVFDNKFYTVYCLPCFVEDYMNIYRLFPKVVDILFLAWADVPAYGYYRAFIPLLEDGDIIIVCKRREAICTREDVLKIMPNVHNTDPCTMMMFFKTASGECLLY